MMFGIRHIKNYSTQYSFSTFCLQGRIDAAPNHRWDAFHAIDLWYRKGTFRL